MSEFVMTEHTLVIEREFDAPRELLWKVWTEPDEVAKWWGPEGFTTPRDTIEIDLRPGGACKMTMVGPDGRSTRTTASSAWSSRPSGSSSARRPSTIR